MTFTKLCANDYAIMRAAWTAMDQTYGKVAVDNLLRPIDNSLRAREQPFDAPTGFSVAVVIESEMGGKFTIYKDAATNTVMLVPMGTNGNSDVVGWLTNLQDEGLSQWTSRPTAAHGVDDVTLADYSSTKDLVFKALDMVLDTVTAAAATLVFAGDSKGGALAQFACNDFLASRNTGQFGDTLGGISNDQICLVTHSAPGVQTVLKDAYNPAMYNGIEVNHSAALLKPDSFSDSIGSDVWEAMWSNDPTFVEAVSQTGGQYADGRGVNYYAMAIDPSVSPANIIQYAHRLTDSGWAFMDGLNGDFSSIIGPGAPKPAANMGSMQELASYFSQFGQGTTVSAVEAYSRIVAGASCALAAAPLAVLNELTKGNSPGLLDVAASVVGYLVPGLSTVGRVVCAGGLAASALTSAGDSNGAIYETGESQPELRLSARATKDPAPGCEAQFVGHDSDGGVLIIDAAKDGSQTNVWIAKNNVFFNVSANTTGVSYKFNDVTFHMDKASQKITVTGGGSPEVVLGAGYQVIPDFDKQCIVFTRLDDMGQRSSAWDFILTKDGSEVWQAQGYSATDTEVSRYGLDLVVQAPEGEALRLPNWYSNDGSGQVNGKVSLQFADSGVVWSQKKLTELGLETHGTANADELRGLAGFKSTLLGGEGNDRLYSSLSGYENSIGDILVGGQGDDYLFGAMGADTIRIGSGGGKDVFYGKGGADIVETYDGLNITNSQTRIEKAGADLRIVFVDGTQLVIRDWEVEGTLMAFREGAEGSAVGYDWVNQHIANFYGNAADNFLIGNAQANQIYGYEGNDYIDGGTGADILKGGEGDDTLYTSGEYADIDGETGADSLYDFGTHNTLRGGDGNDILGMYGNASTGDGGRNNDVFYVGGDSNVARGGAGADSIYNFGVNNTIVGGQDNDVIYDFSGGATIGWTPGDGSDSLAQAGVGTSIQFGASSSPYSVIAVRDAYSNLLLQASTGGAVTIANWFSGANQVDVKLADGSVWTSDDIAAQFRPPTYTITYPNAPVMKIEDAFDVFMSYCMPLSDFVVPGDNRWNYDTREENLRMMLEQHGNPKVDSEGLWYESVTNSFTYQGATTNATIQTEYGVHQGSYWVKGSVDMSWDRWVDESGQEYVALTHVNNSITIEGSWMAPPDYWHPDVWWQDGEIFDYVAITALAERKTTQLDPGVTQVVLGSSVSQASHAAIGTQTFAMSSVSDEQVHDSMVGLVGVNTFVSDAYAMA